MRARSWQAALVAGALLVVAAGCERTEEAARHLVVVTLDTTRADRVGAYGRDAADTPWLDALASRGTLIERAYTPVPITLPAHLSLFSGRFPTRTGVHVNGQQSLAPGATLLAERLRDEGFVTAAAIGAYPVSKRFPTGRGFEYFDETFADPRNPSGLERDAGLVVDAALRLAREAGERRLFLWVHFFDPHDPYAPPEPFASRHARDPYQGEIARVDAALSELETGLRRVLGDDEILFCVVGDHGEALGDHGEDTHGYFIYDSTLRVPMIFAGSRVPEGRTVEGPASLVDVAPTLYSLLDVEPPADMDGGILRLSDQAFVTSGSVYVESELPRTNFGWAPLHGVVADGRKFIEAPTPELYDLERDPGEEENLAPANTDRVETLREVLGAFRSEAGDSPDSSEADDAALRSLGYVGMRGSAEGSGDILHDPKDKLGEYLAFTRASRALEEGRPQDALALTDELLGIRDDEGILVMRVAALRMSGRLDDALALLETLGDSSTGLPQADLERARILVGTEKFDRALAPLERYLSASPRDGEALMLRGAAREFTGDLRGAERDYRDALSINPLFRNASLRLAGLLVSSGRLGAAREHLAGHLVRFPGDELASGLLEAISED